MTYTFGIDTFGDVTADPSGTKLSHAQVVRNVVAEAVRAEEVGVDIFNIGEHHRDDYAIPAPDVVLAAIATRTQRIRLSSAVTVLSSDDPVRVVERFATVDALSNGRAELMVGRGSFTESFPLYGYNLADYEDLFNEKLSLLTELLARNGQPVTWKGGHHTQALNAVTLYPPLEHGPLPTWVAVGGSPESVVRAAHYKLPLMLAIIGGPTSRFVPFTDLYRRAWEQFGNDGAAEVGYHSYGYVARTDEEAVADFFDYYVETNSRIGRERGWRPPSREAFLYEVQNGAMAVGSPETVARKIATGMRELGATRYDLKVSYGSQPHEQNLSSIELFVTELYPGVKELVPAAE
ncbi:LLM class flavin-dependent oxidoreductase [Actinotignum sanguinis]|uniref:LLM class flavin-dependent oxidoreductase n=1 Tax=Actinotignum sanguinis TaxID=1445614 RepID=A0ABT5V6F4_9ACTO|nr:LLM class flavin-dependent oxidoreductase [Actinotignum sanguinis]MDE1656547.1 LLM class flavin-dependent oxidoreductase [Actinotignum sanguinis]